MEGRTLKARRMAWISVSAAAGLIFFYFYSWRPPADPSPAPAAGAPAESGAPSFSGRSATIEPAPGAAASEPKLAVNGVVIAPASRAALISVDGRPATLFVEGQQIVDGIVLHAVNPDRIVVKHGDDLLPLPLRGVESVGSTPGGHPAAEAVSTDPPLPRLPPPPGTEERRNYQSRD